MKRKPCDNCPWRKDAPPGHWDPAHFRDIWRNCQDDGHALMLCHKSKPAEKIEIPCAGAVVVLGFKSIGIRIAALRGKLDVDAYASDVPLFPTFLAMLRANGIRPPKRNRWTP